MIRGTPFAYPGDFVRLVTEAFPEDGDIKEDLAIGGGWSVGLKLEKDHPDLFATWQRIMEENKANSDRTLGW